MITSVSDKGFKKWLNNHAARKAYDGNPGRVSKLGSGQADPVGKLKTLAENKNLVLLTRATFEKKVPGHLFHSVVGGSDKSRRHSLRGIARDGEQ